MRRRANNNGYIGYSKSQLNGRDSMLIYDQLLPDQRKALQEAPYNLSLRMNIPAYIIVESIRRTQNEATLKTYGPTHPQYIEESK